MKAHCLIPLTLLALMLAVPLWAQEGVAEKVQETADAFQEAYSKMLNEYRRETDEEKQKEIQARLPEVFKEYTEKFQALADENAGDPGAAKALAWVTSIGNQSPETRELVTKAQEKLLSDYINSEHLVPAIGMWRGNQETLDKLINESTSKEVQGVALYYKVNALKGFELTEENVEEVKPLMDRIVKEFGDVKLVMITGQVQGTLSELVGNELFAFENLRIGKVAPEIAGADVAGVDFKLSDYRGKVVVLDFWGDW